MSEGYRYRIIGALPSPAQGGVGAAARFSAVGPTTMVWLAPIAERELLEPDDLAHFEALLPQLRHRSMLMLEDVADIGGHAVALHAPFESITLERLRPLGPVPLGVVLEILEEVADALSAAESMLDPTTGTIGLAHGELCLGSILLSPKGEVKVAGLGLSLLQDAPPGGPTRAPERESNGPSHAADVYALGASIAMLLIGEEPPIAERKATRHTPKVASYLDGASRLPDPIRELLRAMLSHDTAERPMAREVQRQAWQLRSSTMDPRLREWASQAVPPLLLKPTSSGGPALASQSLLRIDMTAVGPVPDPGGTPEPVSRRTSSDRPSQPNYQTPVSAGPGSERRGASSTLPSDPSRWDPPALPLSTPQSQPPSPTAAKYVSPPPRPRDSASDAPPPPPEPEEIVISVAPDEIGPELPAPQQEPASPSVAPSAQPSSSELPTPQDSAANPEQGLAQAPQAPPGDKTWKLVMFGSIGITAILFIGLGITVPALLLLGSTAPPPAEPEPIAQRIHKVHPAWAGKSWPLGDSEVISSDPRTLVLEYQDMPPHAVLDHWKRDLGSAGWTNEPLSPGAALTKAVLTYRNQRVTLYARPTAEGTVLTASRER